MKKVLYTLAALSFVFVACNKQEIVPEEGSSQEGELTTVTIKASNGDADTKAAISEGLAFTWTAGDQIAVHTDAGRFYTSEALTTGGTTADFTVSLSGTRDGYAVYPASVAKSWDGTNLTLTLPGTYTYAQVSGNNTPLPMIADNTGATLNFYHVAGLLRLTITNIPTDTNKIKLDFNGKKVSGDFTITSPVADGTAYSSSIAAADSETDIIWITGITGTENLTVNIPLPTGATYSDLTVSAWYGDVALRGQVVAFNTYSPSRAHGKKLSAALNLGAVSIASGKYAVFAPGNLVATITVVDDEETPDNETAATWAFHTEQYNSALETDSEQSVSVGTRFDHFGWSTPLQSNYFGIKTSGDNQHYGGDFKDWGDNEIGDYAANVWRTPNNSEWHYMIQRGDGTHNSTKFGYATVNGKKGIIFVPDVFDGSFDFHSHYEKESETYRDYTNNIYNGDDWVNAETKGAIFLPAAGYRNGGTGILKYTQGNSSPRGYYSSATPSGDEQFKRWGFTTSGVSEDINENRHRGCSVRLVRDLN